MTWSMVGTAAIGVAGSIGGGLLGSSAAGKAARQADRTAQAQLGFAAESRDMARADAAPYRDSGYTALDNLMTLTGMESPRSLRRAVDYGVDESPQDYKYKKAGKATDYDVQKAFQEFAGRKATERELKYYTGRERADQLYFDVVEAGIQRRNTQRREEEGAAVSNAPPRQTPEEMVKADPGYQFRLNEGMFALEKGAASRGGLLSGGFARQALRYGQDYASNEYQNVYNRISNIAGLGQAGVQQSGNAATNYGNQAVNAVGNAGYTRGSSYLAKGNAWGSALEGSAAALGQVDWGAVFGRGGSGGGGSGGGDGGGRVGSDAAIDWANNQRYS